MAKKKRAPSQPAVNIDDLLGEAYTLDQVKRKRGEAVELLRAKFADEETAPMLKREMYRLRDVVRARTVGVHCSCHVSKVCLELLAEAFAPRP